MLRTYVRNLLILVLCLIVVLGVAVLTGVVKDRFTVSDAMNVPVVGNESLDVPRPYDLINSKNPNARWSGPKIGENIDLSGFETDAGRSLTSAIQTPYVLLSLVDEDCKMSSRSMDLIDEVHSFAASRNINAYLISFAKGDTGGVPLTNHQTIHGEEIFIWRSTKLSPPRELEAMVVPSHLLLNSRGFVIAKFPGASDEVEVRRKMAQQIIDDLTEKVPVSH